MARRVKEAHIVNSVSIPYITQNAQLLTESFKSEVMTKPIRFPKELGEEHPFSFEDMEKIAKKVGIAGAAIDHHLDFMISPGFYVESDDENAAKLINDFIKETNFHETLRSLIRESLIKGNGFAEISVGKEVDIRIINANNMYVKRDKKGEVLGYNQYIGGLDKFNPAKVIPFDEDEIVHLPMNQFGDDPYGYGLIYVALKDLDYRAKGIQDMHIMLGRKANSPIIANVGDPERPATQDDVTKLGQKFEYLNNMHEWVFDDKVKVEALDFGNVGDKFINVIDNDRNELFFDFQVPAVLMGMANVPEGLADAQSDSWERRIESLQARAEKIVEEKIFQPILKANGIDAHVNMIWRETTEKENNEKITVLTGILSNSQISPELRSMVEQELAVKLGFDEFIDMLPSPEEARQEHEDNKTMQMGLPSKPFSRPDKQRQKEENKKQPQIPTRTKEIQEFVKKVGSKYCVFSHQTGKNFGCYKSESEAKKRLAQIHSFASAETHIKEMQDDYTIREWVNFDYQNYKNEIIKMIERDKFLDLAGRNRLDYELGLLTPTQIEKLRGILIEGFDKGLTISQMSDRINNELKLKDRLEIGDDGDRILLLSKEERGINIARTESVRLSSEGLLLNYSDKGIKEVRFLASLGERTCPICESMNGQRHDINEASGIIPVHPMCRCTWVAITE